MAAGELARPHTTCRAGDDGLNIGASVLGLSGTAEQESTPKASTKPNLTRNQCWSELPNSCWRASNKTQYKRPTASMTTDDLRPARAPVKPTPVASLVDMASSETNASGDQADGDPKLSQTRLYVFGLAISVTNLTVAFDTTILGKLFGLFTCRCFLLVPVSQLLVRSNLPSPLPERSCNSYNHLRIRHNQPHRLVYQRLSPRDGILPAFLRSANSILPTEVVLYDLRPGA